MVFTCKECAYYTTKKSHFNRHLLTKKHYNNLQNKRETEEQPKKEPKVGLLSKRQPKTTQLHDTKNNPCDTKSHDLYKKHGKISKDDIVENRKKFKILDKKSEKMKISEAKIGKMENISSNFDQKSEKLKINLEKNGKNQDLFEKSGKIKNNFEENVENNEIFSKKINLFKDSETKNEENEENIIDMTSSISNSDDKSETKERFNCEYCNKSFAFRNSLYRHINELRCKNLSNTQEYNIKKNHKNKKINKIKVDDINSAKSILKKEFEKEREYYKRQIEELLIEHNKNKDKAIIKANSISNNSNNNNNTHYINTQNNIVNNLTNLTNNQTNNITLNNFGKEDTSHITEDFMIELLKIPQEIIPRMVEAIHLNKDVPENINIMIPNKKENIVKVVENGKWVSKEKDDALFDLVDSKYYMVDSFYNDMKENRQDELDLKLSKVQQENYVKFSQEYDEDVCNRRRNGPIARFKTKCFFMMVDNKELYLDLDLR